MTNANYFEAGSWNVICDTCKQKKKDSNCRKQWDNLFVCNACWDPKHPYLWPRPVVIDGKAVPIARPRTPDKLVESPNNTTGSIWGSRYWNGSSFVSDLTWENWAEPWGGVSEADYNPTNFPLR